MTHLAMIMAGGASSRMRQSGIDRSKALVSVGGSTLLDRNIDALLRSGFDEIVVACSALRPEVGAYAREIAGKVEARGGVLTVIEETAPLGNIGAVACIRDRPDPLLVVYVDNLTALDLAAIAGHHLSHDATLTIAVHQQPFTMPFGEVLLDGSQVKLYSEKPTTMFTVCSAVAVVGPAARAAIAADEAIGLSDLVSRLLRQGKAVEAFAHDAAWIDINHQAALAEADRLVAANPTLFPAVPW